MPVNQKSPSARSKKTSAKNYADFYSALSNVETSVFPLRKGLMGMVARKKTVKLSYESVCNLAEKIEFLSNDLERLKKGTAPYAPTGFEMMTEKEHKDLKAKENYLNEVINNLNNLDNKRRDEIEDLKIQLAKEEHQKLAAEKSRRVIFLKYTELQERVKKAKKKGASA